MSLPSDHKPPSANAGDRGAEDGPVKLTKGLVLLGLGALLIGLLSGWIMSSVTFID